MAITPPIDYSQWGYTPPTADDLSQGIRENHASQLGALSGAASGASYGKYFGGVGAGIGAGVGALYGYLKGRTNDTKNQREDFAKQLGVGDTTALWQQLNKALSPDVAGELQNRALNKIGKHDTTANQQWMQDVQSALDAAQMHAQTAPVSSATPAAPAMDPRQQSVLDALKGGGNYRDALVAYLGGR